VRTNLSQVRELAFAAPGALPGADISLQNVTVLQL
jgi:hypothetical protein